MRYRQRDGFSMVEVMAVVVIIGILAVIALPRFTVAKQQAYDAVMISDLRNLANVQEAYASEYRTYALPMPDGTIVNDKGDVLWRPSAGVSVDRDPAILLATPVAWRVQLTRAGAQQNCVVAGGDIAAAATTATEADAITCTRASTTVSNRSRSGSNNGAGGATVDSTGTPPE